MNTYHLDLDLQKGPLYNLSNLSSDYGGVTLRQGDKQGCTITADLYDHGERFTQTGLTAFFVMDLPDRTHYYRAPATYDAGTVTILVDESYAASVPGNTDNAYFELLQGGTIIASTQSFRVRILKDARGGKTAGETYDSEIQEALDNLVDLQEATEAAETATSTANAAATAANAAGDWANEAAARAERAVAHDIKIWFDYEDVGGRKLLTLCTTEGEE